MKESARPAVQTGLQSMTGFGSAELPIGAARFRIELKSLNHRYLELKVRLPRELSGAEIALRQSLQKKFARGAIEVKVERVYESASADGAVPRLTVNLPLAHAVHGALKELKHALSLSGEIPLNDVAQYPDVFQRSQIDFTAEEAWQKLEPLVDEASRELLEMRATEGRALSRVIRETVTELGDTIERLRVKRGESVALYPERLRVRLTQLFENFALAADSVAETRIAQELALLADRTDIEEELVRFRGHLDHLAAILDEGGAVGRKIDFILQELNREINTLGNKAQDYQMGTEVVGAKLRIEQLREQALNLE